MSLRLDHIVISVTNLHTAMRDFLEADFRLQYGGKHADGITENALILFADGSYIELIALTEGHSRAESNFKPLLREKGEGFTGYALHSDDLANDLNAMDVRGITVSPVRSGGRARPDGLLLQWQIALLDNAVSPFVIQDMSPREWRVPAFGEDVMHENGAMGIQSLNIHCSNFDASLERYEAITGSPAEVYPSFSRFRIGGTEILLFRNPHYSEEVREDLISLNLLRASGIPQRLSLANSVFILMPAT
jgi:hypothetical protein